MARLRAVVMIQPPGFGGTPSPASAACATTNASWTASSAMSMSPKRRTRVATARPDSCAEDPLDRGAARVGARCAYASGLVLERPHLDRRPAGDRRLGAQASAASRSAASITQKPPSCSFVSANGPSVVSDLAALALDDRRRVRRVQAAGEHPRALRLQLAR